MDHQVLSLVNGSVFFADLGPILVSSNARAAGLLLLCFYLLKAIGRSASFRHLLVASILTGLLFLPLFSLVIPAIDVMVEVTRSELMSFSSESAPASAVAVLAQESWGPRDYLSCAILLYGAGLIFILAKQAWSNISIALVSWAARPVRDSQWLKGLQRAKQTLGIRRPIGLRYSRAISSPMTWGFLKPVVLLPASARTWSNQLIYSALLHEAAHIKRCDWLTQQMARLACAVYWVNPLCWRALRRLEDNAEAACDDLVLSAGVKGTHYASDLIHVAKQVCAGRQMHRAALAMSATSEPSQLVSRVNAILNPAVSRGPSRLSHAVLTLSLVGFVLLPLASLRANYVEVPVFTPDNLVKISTSPSRQTLQNDASRSQSGAVSGTEPVDFDREELKRMAVTELRSTIAKINASTREWLQPQESESEKTGGGDANGNDSEGVAQLPATDERIARAQATAGTEQENSSAELQTVEEPIDTAANASQQTRGNSPPPHPLVALLRGIEKNRPGKNPRYAHTRVIKPEYPRRALARGIEGEVVVTFSIDKNGRVVNPHIVQARPAGVFEENVLRAVEQFQYEPSLVDGRPVKVEIASEVFRFVLKS